MSDDDGVKNKNLMKKFWRTMGRDQSVRA